MSVTKKYSGLLCALWLTLLFTVLLHAAPGAPIKIGSKHFNENYILAEIMAQLLEENNIRVERKFGLGGTLICYQALRNGELDLYPEYSGTIEQAILKLDERVSFAELQSLLSSEQGLSLLNSFGFNNTYALTTRAELGQSLGLRRISDLQEAAP